MGCPTADKLEMYYASKYLSADGGTLTAFAADSGCTTTSIVNAEHTEADDYWNGAIILWNGNVTATLKGKVSHVKDFDSASDTLTLYKALPAAPASGDTYRMILGGNYRSATQLLGLLAAGQWPEIDPQAIPDMENLKVSKVAVYCGAGTGYFDFDYSESTLRFKAPGDTSYGPTVDVSTDTTTYTLYSQTASKWVQVYRNGALPGSDQADKTVSFSIGKGSIFPDIEGDEGQLVAGKLRYHPIVLVNADADVMVGFQFWISPPDGTETTMTSAVATTAGTGTATNISDWPESGFWVLNIDKDDCRYCLYRSGNEFHFAAAGTGLRGYTAQSWESGDAIIPMPFVDIGWDEGSAGQFANPATEETAPSGVTFTTNYSEDTALSHPDVDMAAASKITVWAREWIIACVSNDESQRSHNNMDPILNGLWS